MITSLDPCMNVQIVSLNLKFRQYLKISIWCHPISVNFTPFWTILLFFWLFHQWTNGIQLYLSMSFGCPGCLHLINHHQTYETDGTRSRRPRNLTEKGAAYKSQTLKGRRRKINGGLIRKYSTIEDLLFSSQNAVSIEEELRQFNDLFKMLLSVHE